MRRRQVYALKAEAERQARLDNLPMLSARELREVVIKLKPQIERFETEILKPIKRKGRASKCRPEAS